MERYYPIRGFFKTQPIIIIKINEKLEKVTAVYTLSGNELTEYDRPEEILVNEVNQIPKLEQCLITDKKNKELAEEKLRNILRHIYSEILKKMDSPKGVYTLPEKESLDVQRQIEDAMEFIKTKGLSLKEKIEFKKIEQYDIECSLRKIHVKSKNKLSKLIILSIIGVIATMLCTGKFIENYPKFVQFISSALIAATPIVLSTEFVRNKERNQMQDLIEQYDINVVYLNEYENELKKQKENTSIKYIYEVPELKATNETYMSKEEQITHLIEIKNELMGENKVQNENGTAYQIQPKR